MDNASAITVFAPGRVNLIGEHTDTSRGFVFPMAIQRGVTVRAELAESVCVFESRNQPGEPVQFAIHQPFEASGWARYIKACRDLLVDEFGDRVPNVRMSIDSDLPMGAGLSSSAALEVAVLLAWLRLMGEKLDKTALALLAQRVERDYVGVPCGVMDQMASCHGMAGHALLMDMDTLSVEAVPIPKEMTVVLCDTLSRRELKDGRYAERAAAVKLAAEKLGVPFLRAITNPEALRDLPEPLLSRARHVVSENERCLKFREELVSGNLEGAGALVNESHRSLAEDFEVTGRELDLMAAIAQKIPDCLGARMTGAGFAGACIALVRSEAEAHFIAECTRRYELETGVRPSLQRCIPSAGARIVDSRND